MKKSLVFACCVVGFLLIAAPTNVGHHQVFINGKPFANAGAINGQLFVSVEDFVKASGAKVTLEPFFQLRGSKLTAVWTAEAASANKIKLGAQNKAWGANQLFQVVKPGEISSKIVMENGRAFLPLHDLATAFGATFNVTASALKPNQTINLDSPLHPCPGCSIGAR
jgi:hypothetical protein